MKTTQALSPSPGETFGHYHLRDRLGSGGTGDVYSATDLRSMREVAIKVLREGIAADPHRLHAFETEARAASLLKHPNIITIHDVGTADSVPYIAMELIKGVTLRVLLREGPLETGRLCSIGVQTAAGLADAHDAGIVHRDLKPENLMLTESGLVKILDFGLAKFKGAAGSVLDLPTSSTTTASLRGTVGYMSPEQVNGQSVDFRSDQFSFGIVLYEMATGRRPFTRATPAQTLAAILGADPEPLLSRRIPRSLVLLIEKCLSKNPALRFESTRVLMRQLEAVRDEPAGLGHICEGLVVGVLPFEDLSEDCSLRFFIGGIAEEVRTQIHHLPSVKPLSRHASSQATLSRGRLDAVIEGSVRLSRGRRVRITAAVVDVRSELVLWSAQFDRHLDDILTVQTEVASRIVEALGLLLSSQNSTMNSSRKLDIPPGQTSSWKYSRRKRLSVCKGSG